MKALSQFLRTTLVGGVLFLIPIVVLGFLLGKALKIADRLVGPLATHLPEKTVFAIPSTLLLAILVLVLVCFAAGLIGRTAIGRWMVQSVEQNVLSKVPAYAFLKRRGESLLGVEGQAEMPVVLVRFDDAWQLGMRIDDSPDGMLAVYIPGAPDPESGGVYYVAADRIRATDIPLSSALKCCKRLGAGSRGLLPAGTFGASPMP